MRQFDHLPELPGTPRERAWLERRLETLSVRESYILTAVSMGRPPETAAGAINCVLNLSDCPLYPADSYEALGRFHLGQTSKLPEDVLPYVDSDQLRRPTVKGPTIAGN